MKFPWLWLLVLPALIALAARVIVADWSGLSGDEANGVAIAVTGSWADLYQHLREDGNPPLFYVLTKLYCGIFGSSDASLRVAAIAIGTALIPIIFVFLEPWMGPFVAGQIALFAALCPPLVRYGDLVRMYGLLPLLSFLSSYLLVRGLESRKALVGYFIATTMLLYCHHWGFFVLAAQGLVLLVWKSRLEAGASTTVGAPGGVKSLIPILGVMLLSLLAYTPWVPTLMYALSHHESPWAVLPSLSHFFVEAPAEIFIGKLSVKFGWNEIAVLYAGLWFAASALFSPKMMNPRARLLGYVGVGVFLVACVAASLVPAWRDRYVVALTPMIAILFVSIVSAKRSRHPIFMFTLPVLLWLPFWIPAYQWLLSVPESSAGTIARQINRDANSDRDLVVVSWEAASPAISRVLGQNINLVAFPDIERVSIIKWEEIDSRLRDDGRMIVLFDRMSKTLQAGGTIWLVDSSHNTAAVAAPGQIDLRNYDFQQVEHIRMDQVRSWLNENARRDGKFVWGPGRDMSMFLSHYLPRTQP
jgi:hypothetical protein